MNVGTTNPLASASAPVPKTVLGGTGMAQDGFLKMLVAQLSNQDPLNPQQGHEFAAQLAQFSSVEQLTKIGSLMGQQSGQLGELLAAVNASATQQAGAGEQLARSISVQAASALIGQTVEVTTQTVSFDGQTPAVLGADVPIASTDARLLVRDGAGRVVRSLLLGGAGTTSRTAAWDGLDDTGKAMPAGRYTFEVESGGQSLNAATFVQGKVGRVTIDAGGARLWLGDEALPLSALRSVVSPR